MGLEDSPREGASAMPSKRRQLFRLTGRAILVCWALALSGCGKSEVKHWRLTATVETPQGERQGHSVIETELGLPPPWVKKILGSQAGASMDYRGEAVAVDLPGNQTLFVLLRSKTSVDWAMWMHNDVGTGELRAVPRMKKIPGDEVENYPYFVRFRDIADPRTVEQVDPDDLAKSFGPGVELKSLTVQMTDEPVTTGISKRFSWWSEYRRKHFDGTSTISEAVGDKNLPAHLSSGSFSTEFMK